MDEKYNLQWHELPHHLVGTFKDLREEKHFADVTLVSDDQKQTQAHKVVLSACSPVLKTILLSNPHSCPILYLRGVKQRELQAILNYMYLGETEINEDSIQEFLSVAKDFALEQLSEKEFKKYVEKENQIYYQQDSLSDMNNEIILRNDELEIKLESIQNNENILEKQNQSLNNKTPKAIPIFEAYAKDILSVDNGETINYVKRYFDKEELNCDKTNAKSDLEVDSVKNCEVELISERNDNNFEMKSVNLSIEKENFERFSCHACTASFTRKNSLNTHVQFKHNGIGFLCSQCDFKAAKKSALKIHINSSHLGILYPCTYCVYTASTQTILINHIQAKHEKKNYFCDLCDYKARWNAQLRIHKKKIHVDQISVSKDEEEIDIDDMKSSTTMSDSEHRDVTNMENSFVEQEQNREDRFSCNDCNASFTRKDSLKTHWQFKHNGIGFICSQCDFKTAKKSALKVHINSSHLGIQYLCNMCDFKSRYNTTLLSHKRKNHVEAVSDLDHNDVEKLENLSIEQKQNPNDYNN